MRLPQRTRLLGLCCATWLAVAAAAPAPPAAAQSTAGSAQQITQLEAAFVLNFARFAQWPPSSFTNTRSPLVIAVAGDDALADYLEVLATGEAVGGRAIEVVRIEARDLDFELQRERPRSASRPATLPHVLFLGRGARADVPRLLDELAGADVLTVSDLEGFAEQGGMIGLVLRGRRLTFDANAEQIASSEVSLGSQVLRLAHIVSTRRS